MNGLQPVFVQVSSHPWISITRRFISSLQKAETSWYSMGRWPICQVSGLRNQTGRGSRRRESHRNGVRSSDSAAGLVLLISFMKLLIDKLVSPFRAKCELSEAEVWGKTKPSIFRGGYIHSIHRRLHLWQDGSCLPHFLFAFAQGVQADVAILVFSLQQMVSAEWFECQWICHVEMHLAGGEAGASPKLASFTVTPTPFRSLFPLPLFSLGTYNAVSSLKTRKRSSRSGKSSWRSAEDDKKAKGTCVYKSVYT